MSSTENSKKTLPEKLKEISTNFAVIAENQEAIYDKGREFGEATGFDKGYGEGYNIGFSEGHKAGDSDGEGVDYDNGYNKGYNTGHEAGYSEGYNIGFSEGHNTGHEAGYSEGKSEGIEEEKNRFWDNYQTNGYYTYHFAGCGWTDDTYNPIHPIDAKLGASYMFCASKITDTKVPITLGPGGTYRLFAGADNLKTINKLILIEDSVVFDSSSFEGCETLENIVFEGEICSSISFRDCIKLSKESVRNIFNHLSTTKSGLSLTIRSGTKNKFTDTAWNVLVNSRKNWTICLY